jgi:opacity protein-like surface antigen
MRRVLSALVGAVLLLGSGAFTVAEAAVKKGDKELSVSGIIQSDENQTSFTGIVGFGAFLTDNIEVKAQILAFNINPDEGDDVTLFGGAAQGLYYFNPQEKTVFYAGAGAGFASIDSGDFDESSSLVQAVAGAKHFLTDRTTVFVEYSVSQIFYDDDDITTHQILIGLSYFF